jgi:arylsulfatase A-like enzyme
MKNQKIWLAILLFLTAGSCAKEKNASKDSSRPNILWIMAEDLSQHLGCYGDSLVYSPHIDKIASEGIVYTKAFTCAGVCAPSRAGIITGMYSTTIGTQHMRQAAGVIELQGFPRYNAVPAPHIKAFPEYLRAAGYYTCNNRKTDYQFGEPFTIWDDCSKSAHWRKRPDGKPFFACFTFESSHEINVWPDEVKENFYRKKNINPHNLVYDVVNRPPLPNEGLVKPEEVTLPPYLPDTRTVREDYARLLTNVSRMDQQVGKLLNELEEDGLLETTIIFFMADHGDCFPRAKRWIYDSGTLTPLIIKNPTRNLETGFDSSLVSFTDLAPTVLKMAGVEPPAYMQGKDIFGELRENPHEYVFMGRDRMDNRYDMIRAVRSERYRYIKNYNPETNYTQAIEFMYEMPAMQSILEENSKGNLTPIQNYWLFHSKPEEEFYDLSKDPYEINNLIHDKNLGDEIQKHRKALNDFQEKHGDWGFMDETEQAEMMWPGGKQPLTSIPEINIDENKGSFTLICKTEGASLAYKIMTVWEETDWLLYTGEEKIKSPCLIIAKAVRYGWKESQESTKIINEEIFGNLNW